MAPGEEKPLNAAFLEDALRGRLIGSRIVVLPQTISSNDDAFRMGAAGSAEGLVVFAEEQTGARGQHGRRWESASRKGLWFSILLKPSIAPSQTARLTDWAAAGIAQAIQDATGLSTRIKPPNDIYINDRKAAGVLVEMRAQPRQPHLAIIGIGINVNHTVDDFPGPLRETATSLVLAKGGPVDRTKLAVSVLRRLDETYASIFDR